MKPFVCARSALACLCVRCACRRAAAHKEIAQIVKIYVCPPSPPMLHLAATSGSAMHGNECEITMTTMPLHSDEDDETDDGDTDDDEDDDDKQSSQGGTRALSR